MASMRQVINNVMTTPEEANAAFNILHVLAQRAEAEDGDAVVEVIADLDEGIAKVLFSILVSGLTREQVRQMRRSFMLEAFPRA